MKQFVCIFLFLIVVSCSKDAEVANINNQTVSNFLGEVEYVKNYGGSGEDTAQAIIATTDGGYAVFGFSNSTDGDINAKTTDVNDYWLLKFDAEGNLQWNKILRGQ